MLRQQWTTTEISNEPFTYINIYRISSVYSGIECKLYPLQASVSCGGMLNCAYTNQTVSFNQAVNVYKEDLSLV
jgi:hypothetical protein